MTRMVRVLVVIACALYAAGACATNQYCLSCSSSPTDWFPTQNAGYATVAARFAACGGSFTVDGAGGPSQWAPGTIATYQGFWYNPPRATHGNDCDYQTWWAVYHVVCQDGFQWDDTAHRCTAPLLVIVRPTDQSSFSLSAANSTATPLVPFQADPGAANTATSINWALQLEYQTSGGRGAHTEPYSFTTLGTGTNQQTYASTGGKLTVRASAVIDGIRQNAGPNVAYIVGVSIPNGSITDRLVLLYAGGATPRLLTGIAMMESTYRQFTVSTLYNYSGLWPLESYDGGSHVGLMMMPVSTGHAWDWLANTQDAETLFEQKLAIARSRETQIIAMHPGLPPLSDTDRERMALLLYGPGASGSLSKQYFASTRDNDGNWSWIRNSLGNPVGVTYADSVLSLIQ